MSDLTLHTAVRLRVARGTACQAIVAGAHRVADRFRREQTGQDVLEYSGLIVFVAIIVGLLFAIKAPETIATALANGFNTAFQPAHHYTPPAPVSVPAGAGG